MWFLNCRAQTAGGDVGAVRVTDGTLTYPVPQQAMQDIHGQHVLLGLHGFNVNQAAAIDHFRTWNAMLQLGNSAVFVGGLWPGDSTWLSALEYAFAARAAMQSGVALAQFLNANFTGALSLSLVTHSLGARVGLSLIQALAPSLPVRRLILMAPAVDDDCLTNEFAAAGRRVQQISVLASPCDEVLKLAFPLGNPISGIFAQGHPYWHAALGRKGPSSYPSPNNIEAGWDLPAAWAIDHGDYLPPASPYPTGYLPTAFPLPVDVPTGQSPAPAVGTPPAFNLNGQWQHWTSSWTAALTSSRFR